MDVMIFCGTVVILTFAFVILICAIALVYAVISSVIDSIKDKIQSWKLRRK